VVVVVVYGQHGVVFVGKYVNAVSIVFAVKVNVVGAVGVKEFLDVLFLS